MLKHGLLRVINIVEPIPMKEYLMKSIKIITLFLFAVIATGCTTLADSISAKGTGVSKTYNVSKDEIWPLAVNAVKSSKLDLVSDSKESGIILAQRGVSAFSYGENVAVFVDSPSEKTCKVEVVSKRAMETNIFAPDWSVTILNNITRNLN